MRKRITLLTISLVAVIIFSMGLMAQEKTEITVQVKENGKVVTDTTYQFDDADEARHALKMLEVFSGDCDHEGVHTHGDDCVKKKQIKVVVSGDEEGTWHVDSKELHEIHKSEDVYILKGGDSDNDEVEVEVEVIKKKKNK